MRLDKKMCLLLIYILYLCLCFSHHDTCHRFNATDDDIKRAYRKIVLKHHPDKRKGKGEVISEDDDYFTCITKAYETLGR